MQVTNIKDATDRYAKLETSVISTFSSHNTILNGYFDKISYMSTMLPTYLGQITSLADMITDALVVSGRSNLSKLASDLNVMTNSNMLYDIANNTLQLDKLIKNDYTISNKTSYILTSTDYSIFNKAQDSISSFSQLLLNKEEVSIVTQANNYKYTLVLDLVDNLKINEIVFTLGLTTDSYPLISEIYYIDNENKKVNCFIQNTLSNSYDTNINRVRNNIYNLLISQIETKKLYMVLEDVGHSTLNINSINIRQVQHQTKGSIVFGPLTSINPILKASIETSGSTEGVNFYLSTDASNWLEILAPTELNMQADIRKIMSFNTVNTKSIQLAKDVTALYLKVTMNAITAAGNSTVSKIVKESFTGSNKVLNSTYKVGTVSVYSDTYNVNYGFDKKEININAYKLMDESITKVLYNNTYRVKGFLDTNFSFSDSSTLSLLECIISSTPLKTGSQQIKIPSIEPKSTTLFGYSLAQYTTKQINKDTTNNVVLKLKDTYYKGIYTIRQGNNEIVTDLSTGYIDSTIDGIFIVKPTTPVYLYSSLGEQLSQLTIRVIPNTTVNYVSLIEDGHFELPTEENLTYNMLYPFVLNTESQFGILKGHISCIPKLITISNLYLLNKESIKTVIKLSKENVNQLQVTELSTLDKYLTRQSENISAFSKERAFKLKNQNIKQGSLTVLRADLPYLKEVVYQDGIQEFKTYTSSSITAAVVAPNEFTSTYQVTITAEIDDYTTIQVDIKGKYEVPVYFRQVSGSNNVLEFYTDSSNYFLDGDILEITFLKLSENPSNLYSVNYDEGNIYLSARVNSGLDIDYSCYNTILTGLKVSQLDSGSYTYDTNTISIVNEETNTSYIVDYEIVIAIDLPTTTPFLTETKINYINTLDGDSLP
jgi:hypothetical protein